MSDLKDADGKIQISLTGGVSSVLHPLQTSVLWTFSKLQWKRHIHSMDLSLPAFHLFCSGTLFRGGS
ncbi:MAG: hypothetical protein ACO3VB_09105 [Opitutales bacterium]